MEPKVYAYYENFLPLNHISYQIFNKHFYIYLLMGGAHKFCGTWLEVGDQLGELVIFFQHMEAKDQTQVIHWA